jgi:hypothetical protein
MRLVSQQHLDENDKIAKAIWRPVHEAIVLMTFEVSGNSLHDYSGFNQARWHVKQPFSLQIKALTELRVSKHTFVCP